MWPFTKKPVIEKLAKGDRLVLLLPEHTTQEEVNRFADALDNHFKKFLITTQNVKCVIVNKKTNVSVQRKKCNTK